ncbi:tRNA (adenosine(37)-N6)-threonylcarbamoyltransferase complex dimerization subunit type 1 TsaB [uncultured Limosilactobacillus sp.]|uniref:tRNA (adenosine(37)-N6)-threonylcarbamoyltransferase complex dimerization subunit type 1 TsaB n=1 Tax=uncultured Limosilactobacillus sp. TaxID=2837629 RepID=UPI0025DD891C|nr:tRNA (adenosine(37)-N6)-threonylcarbamoyltransferase complex dimerization subunit type 1 TsaB [uncultured Limosilactobacillus sp.]
MKILAIDTSNHPLTIALVEDDHLLATTTYNMVKNHSIYVLPTIDQLMKQVHWQPGDLDRVVVAQGPGSYTGVRIAVTTAKVLADTLSCELVGISSLAVLAANVPPVSDQLVVPFFDARRGNVYAGGYRWQDGQLVEQFADTHVAMSKLVDQLADQQQPVVMVGQLTRKIKQHFAGNFPANVQLLAPGYAVPAAYQLALLGKERQQVEDINGFVPHYLLLTEAEVEWKKRHPNAPHRNYVQEV